MNKPFWLNNFGRKMSRSEDVDLSTPKLRGYLEVKHCPTNGRSRARLPRKVSLNVWEVGGGTAFFKDAFMKNAI